IVASLQKKTAASLKKRPLILSSYFKGICSPLSALVSLDVHGNARGVIAFVAFSHRIVLVCCRADGVRALLTWGLPLHGHLHRLAWSEASGIDQSERGGAIEELSL